MNWKKVKSDKEIDAALNKFGIHFVSEWENETLTSIIFEDDQGKKLRISAGPYQGIQALVPAPPKTETKYTLTGTLLLVNGPFKLSQVYDTKYEAESARDSFKSIISSEIALTITEIEVEV